MTHTQCKICGSTLRTQGARVIGVCHVCVSGAIPLKRVPRPTYGKAGENGDQSS